VNILIFNQSGLHFYAQNVYSFLF